MSIVTRLATSLHLIFSSYFAGRRWRRAFGAVQGLDGAWSLSFLAQLVRVLGNTTNRSQKAICSESSPETFVDHKSPFVTIEGI